MGALFSFSIYSGIIIALLYLCYKWVLAGENQHWFNRISLWLIYTVALAALPVVTLVSGWLAGTAPVEMASALPAMEIENIPEIFSTPYTEISEPGQPLYLTLLLTTYLIGIVAVTLYTLWVGIRLYSVIHQGEKQKIGKYTLVIIEDSGIAPFSWCRYVVMSRSDWEESGQIILTHELKHLRLCHWIDLLLAQVVGILQWYNPAAWLMREELKTVHEYQADNAVLSAGVNAKEYQMLLIKKAVGARFPSLANSLNHSKLKKRITMMYNSKTSRIRRLRGLALVPACAAALFITDIPAIAALMSDTSSAYIIPETVADYASDDELSVTDNKINEKSLNAQSAVTENEEKRENSPEVDATNDDNRIFDLAETKPSFPGGEAAIMKYVTENIRYPKSALEEGTQGRVILKFAVMKDGSVGNVTIVRSKGEALDNEAIRVIKSLPKFTPGEINGKPVNVWYHLPVIFRLPEGAEKETPKQVPASANTPKTSESATAEANTAATTDPIPDDKIYEVVERKPSFPGGEVALMQYVKENVRFPETADNENARSHVVAQFVVTKNGSIGDVRIVRSSNDDRLDAEAVRVIKSLPKFAPGEMNNQPVNVWYTLPILVKRPNESKQAAQAK